MKTAQELGLFLSSYRTFVKSKEQHKTADFKERTALLFSGYQKLKQRQEIEDESAAHRFNVFQILKMERAETRTHSPFLANLLNPRGSHGQKTLFLHSFIRKFIEEPKSENFIHDHTAYGIQEELNTGNGFIDIWIRSLNPEKPFQIVIENKVYAGDQWNQMTRYRDYLDTFKNGWDSKMMIYLSPFENSGPKSHSMSSEVLKDLTDKSSFRSISYKTDIASWLTKCLDDCKAPKVKHTIEQYLQTIKHL